MDWLGFGASVLGGLFESASASDAYSNQMAMLERQIEANKETMQNRHQWEVNDLRQAGLNPLMSVASPTGTLSAPSPASVQKANIAQSALALGQLNIQEKFAKAAQTSANADMIRASNDTERTQFMIGPEYAMKLGLNNAQIDNINASTQLIKSQEAKQLLENEWLPKLFEAQLNETEMRIATGYLIAYAQDYHLRTTADASIISANAQVMHASSYDRFVSNCEMLGVEEANLLRNESKVAIHKANSIIEDVEDKRRQNRYNSEIESNPVGHASVLTGRTAGEIFGQGRFSNFMRW